MYPVKKLGVQSSCAIGLAKNICNGGFKMFDLYSVRCENCGGVRPEDLKIKCPKCASHKTRLLGYVYDYEAKSFRNLLIIIGGIITLFLTAACLYLFYVYVILGI